MQSWSTHGAKPASLPQLSDKEFADERQFVDQLMGTLSVALRQDRTGTPSCPKGSLEAGAVQYPRPPAFPNSTLVPFEQHPLFLCTCGFKFVCSVAQVFRP